jgi:hypothetical protein
VSVSVSASASGGVGGGGSKGANGGAGGQGAYTPDAESSFKPDTVDLGLSGIGGQIVDLTFMWTMSDISEGFGFTY